MGEDKGGLSGKLVMFHFSICVLVTSVLFGFIERHLRICVFFCLYAILQLKIYFKKKKKINYMANKYMETSPGIKKYISSKIILSLGWQKLSFSFQVVSKMSG